MSTYDIPGSDVDARIAGLVSLGFKADFTLSSAGKSATCRFCRPLMVYDVTGSTVIRHLREHCDDDSHVNSKRGRNARAFIFQRSARIFRNRRGFSETRALIFRIKTARGFPLQLARPFSKRALGLYRKGRAAFPEAPYS